jgi:N-acetylglucosamine kinase-like BadF-type ATPase
MILIADSGGSKLDWRLVSREGKITQAQGSGFNPYYQPIEDLHTHVKSVLKPAVDEEVTKIFFYGTGVSSEKNQQLIRSTLLGYFPGASIEIEWDLLAAARALCGREAGIACIMGTGSNSCLYDGTKISYMVANLGWILADEGSGVYIGKRLLFEYLREKMPKDIAKKFGEKFPLAREEFLERVYQKERPGAFLASFTRFLSGHIADPYCYGIVYSCFADFFTEVVMRYPDHTKFPVHFTGSVAYYFSDILRAVARDKGVTVKNITDSPIAGLTLYHKNDV